MSLSDPGHVTALLQGFRDGNSEAESQLAEAVYQQLLKMARAQMFRERPGHTIQPTALVHEAWLQLVAQADRSWQNRAHFYGIASQLMRRILVDHARRGKTRKRSADGGKPMPLDFDVAAPATRLDDLLLVDSALAQLEKLDARQARIVELRFFGGLTEEEIALLLNVTPRTVRRDWRMARSFLRQQIAGSQTG
jgi:RNA polymerase sigma factor (TIGR02999 family)